MIGQGSGRAPFSAVHFLLRITKIALKLQLACNKGTSNAFALRLLFARMSTPVFLCRFLRYFRLALSPLRYVRGFCCFSNCNHILKFVKDFSLRGTLMNDFPFGSVVFPFCMRVRCTP